MATPTSINVDEARRLAGRLRDAAEGLHQRREGLLARLANGDGIGLSTKVKDDIKVTIGAPPYQHSGSRAGEIVAEKIRGCGDAYAAAEDGLRALSTVMARIVDQLGDTDVLTAEQLNTAVSGLHCLALVSGDEPPPRVDWFGLEAR